MKQRPTLRTERLILRPFSASDAPVVQRLASAREVAENTLSIPHPYPEGAAEAWIATHDDDWEQRRLVHFGIESGGEIVGAMGLILKLDHDMAEVGYWIGVPYWGRGYAGEAVAAVIRYGFEEWELNRIFGAHFGRNGASGRVMARAGMKWEGVLRQHIKKWDEYRDVVFYGILRDEWQR